MWYVYGLSSVRYELNYMFWLETIFNSLCFVNCMGHSEMLATIIMALSGKIVIEFKTWMVTNNNPLYINDTISEATNCWINNSNVNNLICVYNLLYWGLLHIFTIYIFKFKQKWRSFRFGGFFKYTNMHITLLISIW